MNERDFDNIFRRKMEQMPAAAPDQQVWQNIDNQLNTSNNRFGNWSKIALIALLLSSLFSNFFFWKKLGEQNTTIVKNELLKNDTVYNKTVIYKYDTVVTTVHLEQKIVTKTYKETPNSTALSDAKLIDKNKMSIAENNVVLENKKITIKENLADKKEVFTSKSEPQINSNSNTNKPQINENNNTQNTDKEIIVEKNTNIENTNRVEDAAEKSVEKSIEKNVEKATENTTVQEKAIENQVTVTTNKAEEKAALPSKIEPVKDPVFSQWSVGISSLNGIFVGGKGRGGYNGIGLTVATHIKPNWRISANANFAEVDIFDKKSKDDFFHGQKPNVNTDDTLSAWKSKNQPFSQVLFGVERTFNYKKIETFVGVATGLNIILPYEIEHESKRSMGKPVQTYKEEIKKGYATFAGVQISAGASYPIYKRFNITLSTQYQYNTASEKLNWKDQFGFKTGLRYNF